MASFVLFSVTFFLSYFTASYAGVISVKDCNGITNRASNITVEVSDCESGNNCTLYKGSTYQLTTKFTPEEDIRTLNMRTLGVMGVMKVPYMRHRDVCPDATTSGGETCDPTTGLRAGTSYTFIKEFIVRKMYPEIDMKVRLEFHTNTRSTKRNTIFCFEIPIRIKNAPVPENEVDVDE